jgi:hypothetical protein
MDGPWSTIFWIRWKSTRILQDGLWREESRSMALSHIDSRGRDSASLRRRDLGYVRRYYAVYYLLCYSVLCIHLHPNDLSKSSRFMQHRTRGFAFSSNIVF